MLGRRGRPADSGRAAEPVDPKQIGDLVATATADDADAKSRTAALAALIPVLTRSAKTAGIRAVGAGRWITDVVVDLAPHIPVRNAKALREQFPGRSDEEIAQQLVKSASLVSGGLGAAAGGLAAAEFLAPPALLAVPVQLAAEMVAITAVEVKLVAELHEIYGRPASGPFADRAQAYLMAWATRRMVGALSAGPGIAVLGQAAKRELRSALLRRLGRSTTSLAPFLAGAIAGAEVNRRATRTLGERLVGELRGRTGEYDDGRTITVS